MSNLCTTPLQCGEVPREWSDDKAARRMAATEAELARRRAEEKRKREQEQAEAEEAELAAQLRRERMDLQLQLRRAQRRLNGREALPELYYAGVLIVCRCML